MQKDKQLTYKFSGFSEEDLILKLGLDIQENPTGFLDAWMKRASQIAITESEQERLLQLQKRYKFYLRSWNEQELREHFIIPILDLIDFYMADLHIASFSERDVKVNYKQAILQGKVDWMVASGRFAPKQPFFFIHEYKKEKGVTNDPVGQLVATLFAAQLLNQQPPKPDLFDPTPTHFGNVPLYGCYVLGRFWFFVRLKDKKYYISDAYDSTKKEQLAFIFKLLKAQKLMIQDLVKE